MTYSVSVTVLEKFRRFMAGTTSFDTEQSLLDAITGKFQPTEKVIIGRAFHSIIEKCELTEPAEVTYEGITFSPDQVAVALEYKKAHPHMVAEVPTKKLYQSKYFDVLVTGRADIVEGQFIRDAKAKFMAPTAQEYINSSQWKFYLDMFNSPAFYYDVFEIQNFRYIANNRIPDVNIIPYEPLECLAYEGMREELDTLITVFTRYMTVREYTHLLKQIN
jgi:hypothetical protein